MPKDIQAAAALVWSWAIWAAGIAIGLLVMAATAQAFGVRAPYIPHHTAPTGSDYGRKAMDTEAEDV